MNKICLDTSAYSRFKLGEPQVVEIIDSARLVYVPSVALGELRTGFLLGTRAERNEKELREFLADPVVRVLDVDDESSRIYAELMVDLRRAGTPLPTNDIWIAALGIREGATIVTFDAHFKSIVRAGCRILQA
ncbi:MAG: type II toxin-antitoxin system VapC family toxin [Myxococcota bacterium]|jgi:tRNA(fMet)-specific endonuclease VapC